MPIGLEQLKQKYNLGNNFFRTVLCRPEFNKFRASEKFFFIFDDSDEFHETIRNIIQVKKSNTANWRLKTFVFFILFFSYQPAWCQQYEPIIIYSSTGEPQTIIKGHIIYSPHGQPKYTSNGGYTK